MNESTLLDILFEIFNILIACAIGVYIFRKHVLPSIKTEMKDAADYLQSLIKSKKDTRDQCKIVDQNIVDDFEYGQHLLKNIERWSAATERKREEQNVEQAHRKTVLNERIAVQEQTLHTQELLHKAGNELVKQLHVECTERYHDTKSADLFMKNIFDQLKRESS